VSFFTFFYNKLYYFGIYDY